MRTISSATALLLVIASIITPTFSLPIPASSIWDFQPTTSHSQADNQRRHLHLIGSTDGRPLHIRPQQTWDAPLPVIPAPPSTKAFSTTQRHTADELRNWLITRPDKWSSHRRTQAPPPWAPPHAHVHHEVVSSVPAYSYLDFQQHIHILLVGMRGITEHLAVASAVALVIVLSLLFAVERVWKSRGGKEIITQVVRVDEKEKVLQ